jgi:hypothetical protein
MQSQKDAEYVVTVEKERDALLEENKQLKEVVLQLNSDEVKAKLVSDFLHKQLAAMSPSSQ